MSIWAADVLLPLLMVIETCEQVHSLPYKHVHGEGCHNKTAEYVAAGLCCKKCAAGTRLKVKCSATQETICEDCPRGQYMENLNYHKNCFTCGTCKEDNGQQYARKCSATTSARCVCQTGKFCTLGFKPRYSLCEEECVDYTSCTPGNGVSNGVPPDLDVECTPCPDGTFSDKDSYTQVCQPHTDCASRGVSVVSQGNATSDSVCEHVAGRPDDQTNASPTSHSETAREPESPTLQTTIGPSPNTSLINTDSPDDGSSGNHLVAVILGAIGGLSLVIAVIAGLIKKKKTKKAPIFSNKKDANGNSEMIRADYNKLQLTSVTSALPEQQCLVGKEDHRSTISQADPYHDTRPLSGSGCFSIQEDPPMSVSPLQPSPQPTSPQPQVSVNITLHVEVGNGSCATPTSLPLDSSQIDPQLPLGMEEECISVAQQEGGKEILEAIQESGNYLHK